MLQLSKTLFNRPVLSLRTGGQIATAIRPLINPDNFKIEGFFCEDRFSKSELILLSQDIRDFLPQGFVVNDHDVLSEPEELVRFKKIIKINFEIMDKPVVTVNKKRLGKVNDFAADSETLYIQKIYVSQSLIKSLSSGQLSIDRNQIVEVTNRKIVVNEPLQGKKSPVPAAAPATS